MHPLTYNLSGKQAFRCRLSGKQTTDVPLPIRGALLADDMGLGKTLQALALILSSPPSSDPLATLVVTPKSAIPNWLRQVEEHVVPGHLKPVVYEGPKRTDLLPRIVQGKEFNLIFVTYETLTADSKRKNGCTRKGIAPPPTLLGVEFFRLILDEGHQVRSPTSKAFKAVCAVSAVNKVALTGTPFVNRPSDIYSLLHILDVAPLNDWNTFQDQVHQPIKQGRSCGLTRLRTVMGHISLRRTKNKIGSLHLVKKTTIMKLLSYPDNEHKHVHDAIFKIGKFTLAALKQSDLASSAHIFQVTSRLCQAADLAFGIEGPMSGEHALRVIENFSDLSKSFASSPRSYVSLDRDEALPMAPKIQALLQSIDKDMKRSEKGVIFSSFTTVLDIIQTELGNKNISYTRIDGTMTTEERKRRSRKLRSDNLGSPRLILCSLKAAGTGVNLTAANKCYMMDPWWNASTETQAADRIHRLDQTKEVTVYRFVKKDSIEERLMMMQKKKSILAKGIMRLSPREAKLARLTDLKQMFGCDPEKDEEEEAAMNSDFYDEEDSFVVDDEDDWEEF